MKLIAVSIIYILAEIGQASTGPNCYRHTPFVVQTSSQENIIKQTFATITTKSCKDHELCSRLQITDTANETYTALDCLDRNICEHPESWCNQLISDNVFALCEITCCGGNLCAEINRTKAVVTKNPRIQKPTCSIFTPFQVILDSREVTPVYSQLERKLCDTDEKCGGVILTDRNNKTHQASACVNNNHCRNPDAFCATLTDSTNGTFIDCDLKCCNESFCLEDQKSNSTLPKCYEYNSFKLSGDEVKTSRDVQRVKTCNENELCSRGTFTDRQNSTHVSLDCLPKTVCKNPNILCQYFSKSNPESPFVQCNVECCLDNMCYLDSIPISSPPSTLSTIPTTDTTTSSTTKVQTHNGTILKTAVLFCIIWHNILLQ